MVSFDNDGSYTQLVCELLNDQSDCTIKYSDGLVSEVVKNWLNCILSHKKSRIDISSITPLLSELGLTSINDVLQNILSLRIACDDSDFSVSVFTSLRFDDETNLILINYNRQFFNVLRAQLV